MSTGIHSSSRRIAAAIQVVAAGVLLGVILMLLLATVPSLAGYESLVVYGGSMEPAIGMGDIIVVGPAHPEELAAGDVITYRASDRAGKIVTHRLMEIAPNGEGKLVFRTKGDANAAEDRLVVGQDELVGKVAYNIPKIGYLVDFAKGLEGKLLLVLAPAILMLIDFLRGTPALDGRMAGRAPASLGAVAERK